MKESEKKKIDLAELFRRAGYSLPLNESEVEDFERNIQDEETVTPADIENPLDILARGKIKKVNLGDVEVDPNASNNLSMAARDGKDILDEVRKKMNEDRKNAED